jgi:hypothetical protein
MRMLYLIPKIKIIKPSILEKNFYHRWIIYQTCYLDRKIKSRWHSQCIFLETSNDEIDFLQRDIIGEDCTWDIKILDELKPFLNKSSEYFECGSSTFNINNIPQYRILE